jgi:hypothetical protein
MADGAFTGVELLISCGSSASIGGGAGVVEGLAEQPVIRMVATPTIASTVAWCFLFMLTK